MYHLFWAALLVTSLLATTGARATEPSAAFRLKGLAQPVCGFKAGQDRGGSENMTVAHSANGTMTVSIGNLTDPGTAFLRASRISLKFLAVCNAPSEITLMTTRGGLRPDDEIAVLAGNFSTHVEYTAQVSWSGENAELRTNSTPGLTSPSRMVGAASSGELSVDLAVDPADNANFAMIAGTYSDILVLRLAARP